MKDHDNAGSKNFEAVPLPTPDQAVSRVLKEVMPRMADGSVCPPIDAAAPVKTIVYRLVHNYPPTNEEFTSHYGLGRECSKPELLCRWASCSVFASFEAVMKLPRVRDTFKFAIGFEIDNNSGVMKRKRQHIDLWMFDEFTPQSSIKDCKAL